MKKIPRKYFSLVMALIMSSLLSGIFSVLALGVTREALYAFVHRAPVGFAIAFPIAAAVLPVVRRLTERIVG